MGIFLCKKILYWTRTRDLNPCETHGFTHTCETHGFTHTRANHNLHPSHQHLLIRCQFRFTNNFWFWRMFAADDSNGRCNCPASVPVPSTPHNSSRSTISLATPQTCLLHFPLHQTSHVPWICFKSLACAQLKLCFSIEVEELWTWHTQSSPDSDLAGLGIHQDVLLDSKMVVTDGGRSRSKIGLMKTTLIHTFPPGGSTSGQEPWQNNEDDQVGYEYKYPDGGGVHYSRLHMICGDQGPTIAVPLTIM